MLTLPFVDLHRRWQCRRREGKRVQNVAAHDRVRSRDEGESLISLQRRLRREMRELGMNPYQDPFPYLGPSKKFDDPLAEANEADWEEKWLKRI